MSKRMHEFVNRSFPVVSIGIIGFLAISTSCRSPDPLFCNSNEDCAGTEFAFCNLGQDLTELTNTCVNIDPDGEPDIACTGPTECRDTNEVCDTAMGKCVACLESVDCVTNGQNGQVCFPDADPEPVCGCTDHDECSLTKVCNIDSGRCLAEDQVIYVDDDSGAPAATCGALDAQCPTVQDGIDRAKEEGRVFVHVAAGTYAQPLTINLVNPDDTLQVIGAGKDVVNIRPGMQGVPALKVEGQGTVSIDGVKLNTALLNSGHGIDCAGGALRVTRSIIRQNEGIGIQANGCDLTVEQSEIGNAGIALGNKQGGIYITDGTFRLTNNIIADNGTANDTPFGGVRFEGAATGTLEFNTIVGNTKSTSLDAAGVQCGQVQPATTITASNNLVQGNSTDAQVQIGGCRWTHSALDMTAAMVDPADNNIGIDCMTDPTTRRLTAGDTACVDAADPAATVTVDIDGNPRPSPAGGRSDIGAHERQP